jgi:Protein of unknown function (DUF1018)
MRNLPDDHRRRELAQIHIAKKDLAMEEDAYRAVIRTVSNNATDSAGKLDWRGRKRLLDHLKSCGFTGKTNQIFPKTAMWNKVWALWQQLADAGKVNERNAKALLKFCQHHTKVERVQWMDEQMQSGIIEALKSWLNR